jgi:hypothetical protein
LNSEPSPWDTPPALFIWRVFQDRILWVIFLWLVSNHNPPDIHVLSSWDYRHEPLVLSYIQILNIIIKPFSWKYLEPGISGHLSALSRCYSQFPLRVYHPLVITSASVESNFCLNKSILLKTPCVSTPEIVLWQDREPVTHLPWQGDSGELPESRGLQG